MSDTRIGIDLGTCFSSVGYDGPNGIQYLKDPNATQLSYSVPSSALVRDDGRIVFGALAENEKSARPDCYQSEFKRELGSNTPYQLRNREVSAAELTSLFVQFLADATQTTISRTPVGGVVTVPVGYDGTRRALVTAAARKAGLRDVELVHEPVAAVVAAAGNGEIPAVGTTLVYDLGGGTFDAAVIRIDDGAHKVLGAKGLPDFGGTDIDVLIERDFARKAGPQLNDLLAGQKSDDPQVRAKAQRARIAARDLCRTVKHKLSSAEVAYEDLHLTITYELTRAELETMVRPHLERTIAVCRELLAGIGLSVDKIDTVLLVGGACRMPIVGEVVRTQLDRPVRRASDPELTVCLGAALLTRASATEQARTPSAAKKPAAPAEPEPDPTPSGATGAQDPNASGPKQAASTQPAPEVAGTPLKSVRDIVEALVAKKAADETPPTPPTTQTTVASPAKKTAAAAPALPPTRRITRKSADSAWANAHIPTILKKHDRLLPKLYCTTLPKAKVAVARASTKMPAGEKVLGLIDCTMFGSAKDCIVFGEKAIYEAHVSLKGDGYRPILIVTYDALGGTLKTKLQLSGSGITVAAFGKIVEDIRAVLPRVSEAGPPIRNELLGIAYSPDGTLLLAATSGGAAEVWAADSAVDKPQRRVVHSKPVNSVAMSPDGSRLATGSDDGTARLWEAGSGKQIWSHATGRGVWSVAFSPDGTRLAMGCNGGLARVIDTSTGATIAELKHAAAATSVSFSPDGDHLATGSLDGTARVWQWATKSELATFEHEQKVYGVDYSPGGQLLAVATAGNIAEIWDLATRATIFTFTLDSFGRCATFSPDTSMLATATAGGVMTVRHITSGRELLVVDGFRNLWSVAWHPDGTAVATASASGGETWRL